MEQEMLKINILSIAAFGLVILLAGLGLFVFRSAIAPYIRFFLPLPPIAVATYISVFNLFRYYGGRLPATSWITAREIILSTAIAAISFGTFSVLLILIIPFTLKFFR